jgi:hypothetical protein
MAGIVVNIQFLIATKTRIAIKAFNLGHSDRQLGDVSGDILAKNGTIYDAYEKDIAMVQVIKQSFKTLLGQCLYFSFSTHKQCIQVNYTQKHCYDFPKTVHTGEF